MVTHSMKKMIRSSTQKTCGKESNRGSKRDLISNCCGKVWCFDIGCFPGTIHAHTIAGLDDSVFIYQAVKKAVDALKQRVEALMKTPPISFGFGAE
jgi:hypothetical protein